MKNKQMIQKMKESKLVLPAIVLVILILTISIVLYVTNKPEKTNKTESKSGDFSIINGVLLKYNGTSEIVTIPNSVKVVETSAFEDCSQVTSVKIPNTVTKIAAGAFANCSKLNNVKIPDSVTAISDGAFYGCTSLKNITIPDSVKSFGQKTFENTPWLSEKQKEDPLVIMNNIVIDGKKCTGEVAIPNSVTKIGEYSFGGSQLESITIPESVTEIGESAFYECTQLKDVTIPQSVTEIGALAFDQTPWLMDRQEENPLVIINGILIDGKLTKGDVTLPDTIHAIGNFAFGDCSKITSIQIPDSVTSIGDSAFWQCPGLTSITVPKKVERIGVKAFCDCSNLTEIMIPDTVKEIGYSAFDNTPWLSAKRTENPLVIVNGILIDGKNCQGDIVIPNNVTEILDYTFSGCIHLASVEIPKSVTKIGDLVFGNYTNDFTTIISEKDTYVETFSNNHNFKFKEK